MECVAQGADPRRRKRRGAKPTGKPEGQLSGKLDLVALMAGKRWEELAWQIFKAGFNASVLTQTAEELGETQAKSDEEIAEKAALQMAKVFQQFYGITPEETEDAKKIILAAITKAKSTQSLPTATGGQDLGETEALDATTHVRQKERQHILASAAYWFNAARIAQSDGCGDVAVSHMENAYNHVENALAACNEFIEAYFVKGVLRFPDGRTYREHAKELLSRTGGNSHAVGASSPNPPVLAQTRDTEREKQDLGE